MLKLYKVIIWSDPELKTDTIESYVIAGNEIEVQRIIEEELWMLSDVEIKSIEEIDMKFPQFLCMVIDE